MNLRIFAVAALWLAALQPAFAQLTSAEYKEKYDRQVRAVGYAGLGVETILERWASVHPDDTDMLEGRFFFELTRARSTKVLRSPKPKYLNRDPLLTLKDSTGAPVYFFEEEFYDDSLFTCAIRCLERATALQPDEFLYRAHLVNSHNAREKEQPRLAVEELDALISYDKARHPAWTYRGNPTSESFFTDVVQEYCRLYRGIGSPEGYEALRRISERMIKLYPERTEFQLNMAHYWNEAKNNPRKAISICKKILSRHKEEEAAQALLNTLTQS